MYTCHRDPMQRNGCFAAVARTVFVLCSLSAITLQAHDFEFSADDVRDHWMTSHRERRQVGSNMTFKYRWVTQCGYSDTEEHNSIEVKATEHVTDAVLEKTARLIQRMVSFMAPTQYRRLASLVSVGVYLRAAENPGVFPEYTPTEECSTSCEGNCSRFCSDRGIPVTYEVSYGGRLVVAPAENIDCSGSNPSGFQNLLVGAFSMSLYNHALTGEYKDKIDESFKASPSLWQSGIPEEKYFLQASLAWFQSTKLYRSITYGMNNCFGGALCPTERYSRLSIKEKDPKLYETLSDIYSYGRTYIHSGVTICDW